MTDRLTLTRAFEGAGIKSDVADKLSTMLWELEDLRRLLGADPAALPAKP
jgi:hypothetical protein